MKRIVIVVFSTAWLAASTAHAVLLGAGVYAGASIPVLQDDASTGSQFGLRVPVGLIPMLSAEPYVAFSWLGGVSETLGGADYTRSGFDVTNFGINLMLGNPGLLPGFQFFPFVGIGSAKLTRPGTEDISDVCYNFGLGLGVPLPVLGLSMSVRGELAVVATDQTSRKLANVNAGITYKLPLP